MRIKATPGQFIPAFGDGSSALAIATVAKTVPIGIFIVVVFFAFRGELFTLTLWGGEEPGRSTVARQARDTMLPTVFVFVGIEGESVCSRYARDRNDVGIATVPGLLGVPAAEGLHSAALLDAPGTWLCAAAVAALAALLSGTLTI